MKPRRAICFVGCYVGLGVSLWWMYFGPDRDFEQLLAGSQDIAIVSLEIAHTQIVAVNDPASLGYLSEMFRAAEVAGQYDAKELFSGWAYDAQARLSSGRTARCIMHVAKKQDRLLVLFPLDTFDDPRTYLMTLRQPMPKSLADALSKAVAR